MACAATMCARSLVERARGREEGQTSTVPMAEPEEPADDRDEGQPTTLPKGGEGVLQQERTLKCERQLVEDLQPVTWRKDEDMVSTPLDVKCRRQLRPQHSDESAVSTAATLGEVNTPRTPEVEQKEDTPVGWRGKHTRKRRQDRRRKARCRRDEYIAAQLAESREALNDSSQGGLSYSVLEALLEGIAEDDGMEIHADGSSSTSWREDDEPGRLMVLGSEGAAGGQCDDVRRSIAFGQRGGAPAKERQAIEICSGEAIQMIPGATVNASAASPDQEPACKRARVEWDGGKQKSGSCDSHTDSDGDNSLEGYDNSAYAGMEDLADHELLEGLAEGAGLLPTDLVEAMVQLQVASCQGLPDESLVGMKTALDQTVAAFRSKLKRVRWVTHRLVSTWDCPQAIADLWAEIHVWLLGGDDGPCYQLERFQELVEDAEDKNFDDERAKEWLEDELTCRHESLSRGWEQFVSFLEELERASARHVYRAQRQKEDAAHLQAAINARVARSMGAKEPQ